MLLPRIARAGANLLVLGGAAASAVVLPSHGPYKAIETCEQPSHPWQLIEGKHWQILSDASEDAATTDASEGTRGHCPEGMVEVRGNMMVDGWGYADMVDILQQETCADWIDRSFPERCARFDREQWIALSRPIPTLPMHFCIDRFEYPNRRGAYPWIMVNWTDAGEVCAREQKRLCTEAEWTFACEGEEAMPYPHGYERDADACVIDRPWRPFDASALAARDTERARMEIDRLWQGEPSGARPRCRSPFGVYDMTGNVDEWTTSVVAGERPSILKGGYWGPVRTRCRPSTRVHGEDFAFYQQGFRCCSDAPAGRAADDPRAAQPREQPGSIATRVNGS
jgi:formylglycine-generating enzyme